ncbi:hypothetical protein AUEXF2481DRAFT_30645 [Aureobasidium subglaciale EXF-2481]|uniref:Uncharacterized protein n=1 Tax=Aureobasidium subglaciale (strain EXF-2481) TaxID=1043005 RepID=A0A074Y8K0_AURSE|nr:uncharacterized protein AUEXF2481DRAFT_30645 [Aureobasidium subglaciale EXF-2481]KAI5208455.1 hypothetical protein E4T38_02915 [Aureobasidium subglaciale]KAI5227240.1 hypothetical protein E4T40_02648 [Aureobasidium subglaciale]KAI5230556.1 hypothetical protein E4T41_02914 [Aureobasidium subglaciale]KAI5264848.1 hypothetical protein E4T46_02692 [Aureobasidium subglaciale]KEQ94098.1 hypothetical protein AUEXF2481DRAFT_30645 [Aureobasidium subglaciale EXF-2481]
MRASILPTLTAMAVSTEAAKAYIPYVWNTTAPTIHDQAVQAKNGFFTIGGTADGICPSYNPNCSSANKTIITGPVSGKYTGNKTEDFWLGITDSKGQQIYVYDQTLKYTLPRTDVVSGPEEEAINGPFSVDFDDLAQATVLRFQGNDWAACASYDIRNGISTIVQPLVYGGSLWENAYGWECTTFKMVLEETDADAVDHYRRDCPFKWLNCCPELCMGQSWAIVDADGTCLAQ